MGLHPFGKTIDSSYSSIGPIDHSGAEWRACRQHGQDRQDIADLRIHRDLGQWDRLRDLFHPDIKQSAFDWLKQTPLADTARVDAVDGVVMQGAGSTTITNVRVFDGRQLTGPRTVSAENGLIRDEITAPEQVVDGSGATLLPGLIDTHVHVEALGDLETYGHWGVTTVLDMASPNPESLLKLRHRDRVTDLYSAGYPAVAQKSTQTTKMGYPESMALADAADAVRFIDDQARSAVDYIKIIIEDPKQPGTNALPPDVIAALVERAHAGGLKVIAHAMTPVSIRMAVTAGVDILTHAPIAGALDPGVASEVAAKGIVVSPTLTMMRGLTSTLGRRPLFRALAAVKLMPKLEYASARNSTAAYLAAGVTIIAGTDANQDPTAPFSPPAGRSLHDELGLLVEAGLAPVQALRAATVTAAEVFALPDRGAIETGRRADLLLVDGDPTRDITATARIKGVWIKGHRIR